MSRRLIFLAPDDPRLEGATRIEPGYPRDYTEEQMRGWLRDLDAVLDLPPREQERLRQADPAMLTDRERALRTAQSKFLDNPEHGIKGDLRPDGVVELEGGRHRTAYARDEGLTAIPVWVSGSDRELADLERTAAMRRSVTPAREHDTPTRGAER